MEAAGKDTKNDVERRANARFPICRELRYKLLENHSIVAEGKGETIDIGSGGVSFTTAKPLSTGTFIELSISWPVLLDENTRMRLVTFGRLLRSDDCTAVCTVDKYEFRTQARLQTVDLQVRRDSMLLRWVEDMRKGTLKMRRATA
jgi:hypothetical protein